MLDSDLAELYGVETKQLNLAVKRNIDRFPYDFMFQLSEVEYDSLRFQIETLKIGRGKHRKYLPFVFTEQGVAMLSSSLKSKTAILVNIAIIRTFVKLRETLESNKELLNQLNKIESKLLKT
jgi:phage regulator Rha-like protein